VGLSYGSSTASNPRQNIYALTFGFGVGVAQFEKIRDIRERKEFEREAERVQKRPGRWKIRVFFVLGYAAFL
jgi:hypothetical protein